MATQRLVRRPAAPAAAPAPTTVQGAIQQQVNSALTRAKPRRLGGVSTRPDSKGALRQAIASNLQLIADANEQIDKFCRTRDIALEAINKLMREGGFTHEEAHGYVATYIEVFSRASRRVVPQRFYDKLVATSKTKDEAVQKLLGSVEVLLGTAQQFFGEKELVEICDSTPAKSKGFEVKVDEVKTHVKRKPPTPHEE
jgi:NADH:ubiquinone oxidoreductase subunit E